MAHLSLYFPVTGIELDIELGRHLKNVWGMANVPLTMTEVQFLFLRLAVQQSFRILQIFNNFHRWEIYH